MYKNLRSWIKVPFKYKALVGRTGTGSKIFSDVVDELCYPVGEVEVITDSTGNEVVSTKKLFVSNEVEISELDKVIFENRESDIKSIGYYYDEKGNVNLKVVYL